MATALPEYEVFALRYATREAQRRDHFIGGDPHDGPMPMDYFVWVAAGPGAVYLIDTGFTCEMAKERKRTFLRCPIDSLVLLGVEAGSVRDVILTHMHYDHLGNFHKLPNARFHLQERGDGVCHGQVHALSQTRPQLPRRGRGRHGAPELQGTRGDVLGGGRYRARHHIAPHLWSLTWAAIGARAHKTRLAGARLRCHALRRDYAHQPPVHHGLSYGEMLDAFRTLERLAPTPRHIVPGHDPYVMKEYPAPKHPWGHRRAPRRRAHCAGAHVREPRSAITSARCGPWEQGHDD